MPKLFCFGLGYSAMALARRLRAEGWRVAGTSRDGARLAALRQDGIEAYLFDRDHPLPDPARLFDGVTHMLVSIPPDEGGDAALDLHGRDIAAIEGLRWLGYLSTTGVYGDHGGGWVDEATPVNPTVGRAKRRAAAEAGWLALHADKGVPVHLFRLAGIYGPGRSPIDALKAGRAKRIDKPGQYFSRIHVEDIAAVLEASIERPDPGAVYNVCDDEPASPAEVIAYAAELLGVAPPPLAPFDRAELSPMARSFYADNKRVRNNRIKTELGVRLRYPTYREGLRSLLASAGNAG